MSALSSDPASLHRDALALDSIHNRLLALVLRERAAYRLMYLSAFALAVELQATVTRQEEQIEQQRALWSRTATRIFGPNGEADL